MSQQHAETAARTAIKLKEQLSHCTLADLDFLAKKCIDMGTGPSAYAELVEQLEELFPAMSEDDAQPAL